MLGCCASSQPVPFGSKRPPCHLVPVPFPHQALHNYGAATHTDSAVPTHVVLHCPQCPLNTSPPPVTLLLRRPAGHFLSGERAHSRAGQVHWQPHGRCVGTHVAAALRTAAEVPCYALSSACKVNCTFCCLSHFTGSVEREGLLQVGSTLGSLCCPAVQASPAIGRSLVWSRQPCSRQAGRKPRQLLTCSELGSSNRLCLPQTVHS